MAAIDYSPVGLIAGADLSAKLYRFGKMSSSNVVACSVAGERADGVIVSAPAASGRAVDLAVDRVIPVEYGDTVTKGDSLTTDSVGRAVTATTGQYVNGIALVTGTVGMIGEMLAPLAAAVNTEYAAVSASGAIPPTASTVDLTVSGTKAYTLADGTVGHEIDILCVSAASSPLGTLTIATVFGSESTTHVFTTAGQRLKLRMTATGWKVAAKTRTGSLTVVVGTDVLTGHDMVATYNLSITGTVTSDTTKAIPSGQVEGEAIWIRCTTAASTPNGSISITAKTLAGAAATAAAVNATTDYEYLRWDGSAFQELITNSVTLS